MKVGYVQLNGYGSKAYLNEEPDDYVVANGLDGLAIHSDNVIVFHDTREVML